MSAENVHRETGLLANEPSHVSDAFVEAASLEAAVLDSLAEAADDIPADSATAPDQPVAEPYDADSADTDDAADADADRPPQTATQKPTPTPTPTTVRNSRPLQLRPPGPCPPNVLP